MLVLSGMVLRWTVASPFLLDEKMLEDVGLRKKTMPGSNPGWLTLAKLLNLSDSYISDLKNDNGNSYFPGLCVSPISEAHARPGIPPAQAGRDCGLRFLGALLSPLCSRCILRNTDATHTCRLDAPTSDTPSPAFLRERLSLTAGASRCASRAGHVGGLGPAVTRFRTHQG